LYWWAAGFAAANTGDMTSMDIAAPMMKAVRCLVFIVERLLAHRPFFDGLADG
jgi:hypothetical protein